MWTWKEIFVTASVSLKHIMPLYEWYFPENNNYLDLITLSVSFSINFLFSSHFVGVACLSVKMDLSRAQLVPVLADLLQDQR